MIITKTPFRMSFFGGGTDLPEYFDLPGEKGAVISTTIDKYVYVTVRHLPRFFDYSTEIQYAKQERVVSVEEIEHPLVRNAMKFLNMHELHISYDADLPNRTGLGTSSTFAVGLLNAFYALKNNFVSKNQLAKDAIYLERVLCNEAGGWQDQIAAAFGGFNRIDFRDGEYRITPIVINHDKRKQLNENLLLFFTGFTRFSADVQEKATKEFNENKEEKIKLLRLLYNLVDEAQEILENGNKSIDEFGRLLDKEWEIKKQLSSDVTNEKLDKIYCKAKKAGALGGKLLGAGGGGFFIFYVPKEKQQDVRNALRLMEVPFEFERDGARVVYYSPEFYNVNESLEDPKEEK